MMRDVVQNAGLEIFAEFGLALFFVAFISIGLRAWIMSQKEADQAAHLPLDDGQSAQEA